MAYTTDQVAASKSHAYDVIYASIFDGDKKKAIYSWCANNFGSMTEWNPAVS